MVKEIKEVTDLINKDDKENTEKIKHVVDNLFMYNNRQLMALKKLLETELRSRGIIKKEVE